MDLHTIVTKTKLQQFVFLIIYVLLLNIFCELIGILFVDSFRHWSGDGMISDIGNIIGTLITCIFYALLQIFIFPIDKKYRIIIVAWIYHTLFLWLTHNDMDGGELMFIIMAELSQFNSVIGSIIYTCNCDCQLALQDLLFEFNDFYLFPLYLIFVGYTFRLFYGIFARKFCKKIGQAI